MTTKEPQAGTQTAPATSSAQSETSTSAARLQLRAAGGYEQQAAMLSPRQARLQLSPRQTPGTHDDLDYQTDRDGPRHDPEEVRNPDSRLPYTGRNSWNAQQILTTLSQVDSDDTTQTDLHRCAAASILAAHINSGPAAVGNVALNTVNAFSEYFRQHNPNWDEQERERNTVLLRDLAAGMGRLRVMQGTYRDLQRLANGMKIVAPSGERGGTVNEDYATYDRLGGAMSVVNTNHTGLADLPGLISQLSGHPNQSFILGVNQREGDDGHVNHAVTLGCDAQGRIYLYDPWPRQGSQIMYWPASRRDIEDYFHTRDGQDRSWIVKQVVIAESNTLSSP